MSIEALWRYNDNDIVAITTLWCPTDDSIVAIGWLKTFRLRNEIMHWSTVSIKLREISSKINNNIMAAHPPKSRGASGLEALRCGLYSPESVVLKLSWAVAPSEFNWRILNISWHLDYAISRQSYLVKASVRGPQRTAAWPPMGPRASFEKLCLEWRWQPLMKLSHNVLKVRIIMICNAENAYGKFVKRYKFVKIH